MTTATTWGAWRDADRRNDQWLDIALTRGSRFAIIAGWTVLERRQDGVAFRRSGVTLAAGMPSFQTVILSGGYLDNAPWLHVSTAWTNRLPTFEELRDVRTVFISDELIAVQVFPPKAEYVNVHPFCLHLYARVDARTVPDLRIEGTI